MARILIGWEIGGGQGHGLRIKHHKDALEARGNQVVVYLKLPQNALPDGKQGAFWPIELQKPIAAHSLGDVLIGMGIGIPGHFNSIVAKWQAILKDEQPDIVIADFAPALLVACRGRLPSILIGNGYDCPPSTLKSFTSLTGQKPCSEVMAANQAGVEFLPEIFAADHTVIQSIPWIDPYEKTRIGQHILPHPESPLSQHGQAVFVYAPHGIPKTLGSCLEASGLPIIQSTDKMYDWPEIARRSCCVVSHGGCGTVTQAVLAGLPQIAITGDLEKLNYGRQIKERQLGDWFVTPWFKEDQFIKSLKALYGEQSYLERARQEAIRLREEVGESPIKKVADIVDSLI